MLLFLIDDISCRDCGLLIAAYAEFTSEGLEVPSCGLSAETLHMRYVSLLGNYEI